MRRGQRPSTYVPLLANVRERPEFRPWAGVLCGDIKIKLDFDEQLRILVSNTVLLTQILKTTVTDVEIESL